MKKMYLIIVIIIVLFSIGIIYNKKHNDNRYFDLSHITNENLDSLYIKGRNSDYNKALNYLYGDKSKATKLSDGSTAHEILIFYDENGKEKLKIDFLGNQNQVRIDNIKYLYKEKNIANHRTKELYPDKNKSDCEKLLFNIIKLYDNDDRYMWDYYKEKGYDYPENYTNGVHFSNEGVNVTILEYDGNTIENDYIKECNRIESWYGGKLIDSFTSEIKKINNYIGANEDFKFTVIKYDKFIISIEYSYDYRYQNSIEVNKNIETINKYLKELNIL